MSATKEFQFPASQKVSIEANLKMGMLFPGSAVPSESDPQSYDDMKYPMPLEHIVSSDSDINHEGANYIIMLRAPAISMSFREKLHTSPEIDDLISDDIYFKYALYNIFNLLEKSLSNIENSYQVSVILDNEEISERNRVDVVVRVKESNYDHIFKLWNDVGTVIVAYLTSLKEKTTMPKPIAENLYNFINIIFSPGV